MMHSLVPLRCVASCFLFVSSSTIAERNNFRNYENLPIIKNDVAFFS